MKEINIQRGEGVSQAIKRQLKEEGVREEQFKGSVWSKIQQALQDNESTLSHKGKESKIGELWATLKTNVKTYVDDVLKITDTTWNKIVGLFGAAGTAGAAGAGSAQGTGDTGAAQGAAEGAEEAEEAEGAEEAAGAEEAEEADDAEKVEPPKVTIDKKDTSAVQNHTKAAKEKVAKLKELFGKTPVPMKEVEKVLGEVTKYNLTAYVVKEYPELADKIDGVFRLGFGFDKKDVFKMVLKPLIARAKNLGISINGEFSENMDFSEMKKAIKLISEAIVEQETDIDENNKIYNLNVDKAQEKCNRALSKLAEAANTKPEICESEGDRKCRYCTLEDGTDIWVDYDESGKIDSVCISFPDNSYGTDHASVRFDSDGFNADLDDDFDANGLEFKQKPSGYDYNQIVELAKKIFGEWDD